MNWSARAPEVSTTPDTSVTSYCTAAWVANSPQRVVQRLIAFMLRRCRAVIKACGGHNQCRYVGHPCVPHMTVYTFQVDSQRYCSGHVHSKPLPWPLRLVLLVSCLPVLLLNQCQVFCLIFVVVGVFFGGFCSFLEVFFKSMYIFICRDMIEFYHFIKLSGTKEMFYVTTHSTHFIYGYMASDIW